MTRARMLLALLVGLPLLAGPASALYVETPLLMRGSAERAEVGDQVNFTIEPTNGSTTQEWAGRTVRIILSYDNATRSDDPDAPAHDGEWARVPMGAPFALDSEARGAFTWTVPQDLDDKNVGLLLEDEEGNLLATDDVAIGDAEPMMRIAAVGQEPEAPGAPEQVDDEPAPPVQNDLGREEPPRDVPLAPALAVAAVALAAVLVGRTRAR